MCTNNFAYKKDSFECLKIRVIASVSSCPKPCP